MALIAASCVRTCLGDGPATFAALLDGRDGIGGLPHIDPDSVGVDRAYPITGAGPEAPLPASRWLAECVADVLAAAGVPAAGRSGAARVPVLVGTGLRELRAAERWAVDAVDVAPERLHFTAAVRAVSDRLGPVITVSNACSASGHALALAQDLVEREAADAVVVAGADGMTASMLAMIGRVAERRTDRIRPFDADRTGVLLGEGAAAVVVVPDGWAGPAVATLLATGMSCDAYHETAPSVEGIVRAMRDALTRAGRGPADVDLVVSHGTGTALNDVAEAAAVREVLHAGGGRPLVTGVKGALGHTSGASALINVDVGIRCLSTGQVPPVVGLRTPMSEGADLNLVRERAVPYEPALVQANSFGFGGVNAVTLLARPV